MLRQARITALSKVVSVKEVLNLVEALKTALDHKDEGQVLACLTALDDEFISLEVQQRTGVRELAQRAASCEGATGAAEAKGGGVAFTFCKEVRDLAARLDERWCAVAAEGRRRKEVRALHGLADEDDVSPGTVHAVDLASRSRGHKAPAEASRAAFHVQDTHDMVPETAAGAELSSDSDDDFISPKRRRIEKKPAAAEPTRGTIGSFFAPAGKQRGGGGGSCGAGAGPRQGRITDLKKVVPVEEVIRLKEELIASTSKPKVCLTVLKKLDDTFVSTEALQKTLVGRIVMKISRKAPNDQVRKLAGELVSKWRLVAEAGTHRRRKLRERGLAGKKDRAPGTVHLKSPQLSKSSVSGTGTTPSPPVLAASRAGAAKVGAVKRRRRGAKKSDSVAPSKALTSRSAPQLAQLSMERI